MPKTLGDNLKRLRGEMRQEELEATSGVAQGDISKYEKNKALPTIPSLLKLAKGLKLPVDALLNGIDVDYDEMVRDLLRHADHRSSAAAQSDSQLGGPVDVTASSASTRVLAQELLDLADDFRGAVQDVAHRLAGDMEGAEDARATGTDQGRQAPRIRRPRKND